MSPVDRAREQLQSALDDLDLDIEGLQHERAKVVAALEALGGVPVVAEPEPEPVVEVPKVAAKRAKKAKKASAKWTDHRGQRIGADHYRLVAQVYEEARSEGRSTTAAIAEHFGVDASTARNWPNRCRKLGLLPPPPTKPVHVNSVPADSFGPVQKPAVKVVEAPPVPAEPIPDMSLDEILADPEHPDSYEEIALAYLAAEAANQRPIQAIADEFDVQKATAQGWVNVCRERGLLRPRDEPQIDRVAPNPPVQVSSF